MNSDPSFVIFCHFYLSNNKACVILFRNNSDVKKFRMKSKEQKVVTSRILGDAGFGNRVLHGMAQLWSDEALFDYTITTSDGKDFKAHRAFLASVSDYFKAMLCGSMLESATDRVELKGINSCGFGALLQFLYTGRLKLNETIVQDVLTAASHLQIDSAIMLCAQFLEESLKLNNCVDVVQISEIYSLPRLHEKANDFIVANFSDLVKNGHHCRLTAAQLSSYLKSDELKCGTEFGLFNCIRQWLDYDREARLKQSAEMMQFVRFPLMLPSDITEISKSSPELTCPGSPCKKFLDQAVRYHKMKQNARLALKSSQTTIRNKPTVVSFSGDIDDHTTSKSFFVLGHDRKWRKLPDLKHSFSHASVTVLENYMYVCGGVVSDGHSRRATNMCYVFDPRFMHWSSISNMNEGRSHFSLVTCKDAIYAIGGCTGFNSATNTPTVNTDTIEKYSVEKDEWEIVGDLPFAVRNHASCVLDGKIYICGGLKEDWMASKKFHCFDPGSMQLTELSDMHHVRFSHHMITMWDETRGQDVLCTVDTAECETHYYDPSNDQVTCVLHIICIFSIVAISAALYGLDLINL